MFLRSYGLLIRFGKNKITNKIYHDYFQFYIGQRKSCKWSDTESSKSPQSSRLSVEHMSSILERLKNKQTRSSTAKIYLSIWRQLNRFIIRLDHKQNLSWEDKTALFGAYLVEKGVQSSTLRSYFSAIKHVLKQDGYEWDDNKMVLSALIRGCKLENDSAKIRLPIQKGLFELLLFELERKFGGGNPQPYLEHMYKALFSLAYYGMMKVGELALGDHTLKARNVHVSYNRDKLLVVLYSSKTHGRESRPQNIRIRSNQKYPGKKQRFFCPVQAVLTYMNIRGSYAIPSEHFFTFADKSPILPRHVRQTLRELLELVNLDSQL